jgi:hypothetical protein
MSQSLILIDVLSSACWEKKKKKEMAEVSATPHPRARHTLLAVLHGIFAAVRWN